MSKKCCVPVVINVGGGDVSPGELQTIVAVVDPASAATSPGDTVNIPITFPPGSFTDPPVVTATIGPSGATNRILHRIINVTATGFTAVVEDTRAAGTNIAGPSNIHYHAMMPT